MLQTGRPRTILASACLCLLVLSGCSTKPRATVNGTLVLPAGITLADDDTVQITFDPEDNSSPATQAQVTPKEKSFVVKGTDGKGILAGKYKVAVQITPYLGMPGSQKHAASFDDINKTFGATSSSLTYEVTADPTQTITIDLAKKTVTKS